MKPGRLFDMHFGKVALIGAGPGAPDLLALHAAAIRVEIIPGITSDVATPAGIGEVATLAQV